MYRRRNLNIRDKNFRREVGVAKNKYRKKRFSLFLFISFLILFLLSIRIYFFINEENSLKARIDEQKKEIFELEKEHKANDILISKFNDPYFIVDLARQEYSMSYPGELIFNLPLRDSFIDNYIKNVKDGKIEDIESKNIKIDENKLRDLLKKKEEEEKKEDKETKETINKKEDKNKEENNQDD